MPWGRVDDTYYDHPKLEELLGTGDWPDRVVAAGLNALAWSWCNRFLTDGKVPRSTVARLMGHLISADQATSIADKLVAVGLWEEAPGGYAIHDFLVYNDSREQVLERRSKEAARKAAYRAGKRPTGTPGGTPSVANGSVPPLVPTSVPAGHGPNVPPLVPPLSRAESRDSSRARFPTRPDPTRPNDSLQRGSSRGRANGRADIEALHDRGWKRVTKAQRAVLDEVLARHDVTGPGFAAEVIRATAVDRDPLEAVMAADRMWQDAQRRKADADEAAWAQTKVDERGPTKLGDVLRKAAKTKAEEPAATPTDPDWMTS